MKARYTNYTREDAVEEGAHLWEVDPSKIVFTCDDCVIKDECEWAFDLYNIDGDCLALK